MKKYCPNCHGELEYESIGMKCTKCKGFIDMHGNFHKYVERPFMPPKTNFLKITESVESLAKFLLNLTKECHYRGCEKCVLQDCQCYDVTKIIEWLQKEINDEEDK